MEDAFSQSRQGYIRAGDESMEKNDPVSALNYYREALSYSADQEIYYKTGNALKALHDYPAALSMFQSSHKEKTTDSTIFRINFLEMLDLFKRLGKTEETSVLISDPPGFTGKDSIRYLNILRGLHNVSITKDKWKPWQIEHTGTIINSSWSDFAAVPVGDSVLYFSSLQFPSGKANDQKLTSKILTSEIKNGNFGKPKPLPDVINQRSWNNANASISADGQIMIFTRCDFNENNELICSLFETIFKNNNWQVPVKLSDSINVKGYTSTQPCITTNRAEGYVLYFSSDRPGSLGGNDIWISQRNAAGKYTRPVNAGSLINTEADELTPFYDAIGDTLYFSSERDSGYGGLDIYYAEYKNGNAVTVNFSDLNSGYNDLYFSRGYGPADLRFLVSNRPPSAKFSGSACCYDIYRIIPSIPVPPDSNDIIDSSKSSVTEPLQIASATVESINTGLPLNLYFDNDYPDPKSNRPETRHRYDELVNRYVGRLPEYKSNLETDSLKNASEEFFTDSVLGNFNRLSEITHRIAGILESGHSLELSVRGHASPLATAAYNLTLSSRRIFSIKNYWLSWNNGRLKKFLDNGMLKIYEQPTGENLAAVSVSDDPKNKSGSVYNPSAALERRIEITELRLIQP